MIEVLDLVKYHGTQRVLDGVSCRCAPAKWPSSLGRRGAARARCCAASTVGDLSGKAKSASDEARFRAGEAGRDGQHTLRNDAATGGHGVPTIPPFPHMTVLANVMSGPVHVLGASRPEAAEAARALLERVGLLDKMNARPEDLSGGQQTARGHRACAAMKPEAILFDEPTSALDPRHGRRSSQSDRGVAAAGQTMWSSRTPSSSPAASPTRCHVMNAGRVVGIRPAGQVLDAPSDTLTRSFLTQVAGA